MAFDFKRPLDWPARVIGLAVFLTGVGLLVLVFIWANQTLAPPTTPPNQPINWNSMHRVDSWAALLV